MGMSSARLQSWGGTWLAVAGGVAVFGAAILLVSFGSYLIAEGARRKKARERAKGREGRRNV